MVKSHIIDITLYSLMWQARSAL